MERNDIYFTFSGSIDYDASRRIIGAVNSAMNENRSTIYISLNSLGGSIPDGIYLYNYLSGLQGDIVFHNVGSVSSIALIVFLSGKRRYANKFSLFMTHMSTSSYNGPLTPAQLLSLHSDLVRMDSFIEHILVEKAAMPEYALSKRRTEDVYFTPIEAQQFSIVQEVKEFLVPAGSQVFQI